MEKAKILDFLKKENEDTDAVDVKQKGTWGGYEVWYSVFENPDEAAYGIPQCALVKGDEIKMCDPYDASKIFLSHFHNSNDQK